MTIKQRILNWINMLPDDTEFTVYEAKKAVKAYTHHVEDVFCDLTNQGIIDRVKWGRYRKGKVLLVLEE